jgi:death-on-curing protein
VSAIRWLDTELILAIHDIQIAEHGGAAGVRDLGLLESALARARNLAAYETPTVVEMAAAYAFGIARNHPFTDGNKRTSLVAAELFLDLNGYELIADDLSCVMTWLALAAGDLSEGELAVWLRANARER